MNLFGAKLTDIFIYVIFGLLLIFWEPFRYLAAMDYFSKALIQWLMDQGVDYTSRESLKEYFTKKVGGSKQ